MSSPVAFRTGKLPVTDAPKVRLTRALVASFTPTPPPIVRYDQAVPISKWGMDANDRIGCCVLAEADHTTKTRTMVTGNLPPATTNTEIIAAYSAVTGYDPADPDSDRGAVMQDARDYWRKHGIIFGGVLDKILLFAQVDHRDTRLVQWSVHQFGAVGIGFNFPDSAMSQFKYGQPWDVVTGDRTDGGHAVTAAGYDSDYLYVVTWGRVQRMTWRFFAKYVDEVWVDLDESFVNSVSGLDPLAQTLYQLGEQFHAVTGQANPIPAPINPTPPEPPVTDEVTVTLTDDQVAVMDGWARTRLYSGTAAAKRAWRAARHLD